MGWLGILQFWHGTAQQLASSAAQQVAAAGHVQSAGCQLHHSPHYHTHSGVKSMGTQPVVSAYVPMAASCFSLPHNSTKNNSLHKSQHPPSHHSPPINVKILGPLQKITGNVQAPPPSHPFVLQPDRVTALLLQSNAPLLNSMKLVIPLHFIS